MRRLRLVLATLAIGTATIVLPASSAVGATATDIVVLGGSGAVSDSVVAQLASCTTGTVTRLSGSDRFATAAAISAATFQPGIPIVAIATGSNFPDALAGGAAAGASGGPVLLVASNSIPAATAQELARLAPKEIVILGGTGAVSAAVEASLKAFTSGPVTRISGSNRYATAAATSAATFSPATTENAWVATGTNFPDALAGGPVAILNGGPVLLVERDTIPDSVQTELARLKLSTINVFGGTGAVSAAVEAQLGAFASVSVTRFAGANRYATAARVSESQFTGGVGAITVATGENFPDALAGGPAAAARQGPLLLVTKNSVPAETAAEISRLTGTACGVTPPPPAPGTCANVAAVLKAQQTGPDCEVKDLPGQAIYKLGSDDYTFADGTGTVKIDINTGSADPNVPLNTPIIITGRISSKDVEVDAWSVIP